MGLVFDFKFHTIMSINFFSNTTIIIILSYADCISGTKASFEAEMEEKEGYAY